MEAKIREGEFMFTEGKYIINTGVSTYLYKIRGNVFK